jgi:hypothetical protein
MKLLVVVATLNGSLIALSIASTFTAPEPIPRSPESVPAPNMMAKAAGTCSATYASRCPSSGYAPRRFSRIASASGEWPSALPEAGRSDVHAE